MWLLNWIFLEFLKKFEVVLEFREGRFKLKILVVIFIYNECL